MESKLRDQDWTFLRTEPLDDAVGSFYHILDSNITRFIPQSVKEQTKSSIPWLNDKCRMAIASKHAAEDTERYADAATHCQTILHQEHLRYHNELKTQMEKLPRSSKKWWTIAKQLMHRNSKQSMFPPLKLDDGQWIKEPIEKANAFAKCFSSKFVLPPEAHEQAFFPVQPCMLDINIIRTRAVKNELSALRLNQASGPDLIGAVVLRTMSQVLALPIAILCR